MSVSTFSFGIEDSDWPSRRHQMVRATSSYPNHTEPTPTTTTPYPLATNKPSASQVHTIEIIPQLVVSARDVLVDLGYANVTVYEGDGYADLPDGAPFDAIMVTAAPPVITSTLLDQLKPGGRLVAPVGPRDATQWLKVWIKQADGSCKIQTIIPVRFVQW